MSQLTLVVVVVVVVVVVEPVADALGLGGGLAATPSAVWLRLECPPPENAMNAPRTKPNATGMAMGTAKRAMRLRPMRLPRRVTMQFTSMSGSMLRPATLG